MIRIDRVTTRGGDGGETSLGNGTRVGKDAPRVEALGAVDEANAAIGLLAAAPCLAADAKAMLLAMQNDLFDLGADLAVPDAVPDRFRLGDAPLRRLEAEIAALLAPLPPLTSFVLPGGSEAAARAHLARTVLRRAERRVVALSHAEPLNPLLVRFLNRASDHLFALARRLNAGGEEPTWKPGAGA